ncbi:hypothetical protein DFJ43DRAFT_1040987 [Lentinula guzmanii]|uniref:Uncharacterized protein n=1 Tax=Lentinula guzmanii TaxID=2804957 RepID=A0AA38MZ78_9AGAR|nr:hypothetical protein DFJ43DRAFT_1040987 [Lentinula guzmanii]
MFSGKSRSAAKTAIEEALHLRKAQDTLRDSIKNLENIIIDGALELYEIAEAEMELPNLQERLDKRLQARKFERDRLERTFRRQLNSLDDSEQTTYLPLWLVDEGVRMGIQGILLRDRCDEELQRLRYELKSLAEWHSEEWTIVNMAIAAIQAVQWTQALAGLPSEVVPCFAVPEGEELIDVQHEVDAELIEDEDEMDQC